MLLMLNSWKIFWIYILVLRLLMTSVFCLIYERNSRLCWACFLFFCATYSCFAILLCIYKVFLLLVAFFSYCSFKHRCLLVGWCPFHFCRISGCGKDEKLSKSGKKRPFIISLKLYIHKYSKFAACESTNHLKIGSTACLLRLEKLKTCKSLIYKY